MLSNLRHTQTKSNAYFASGALDELCALCKPEGMIVRLEEIRKRNGKRLEDLAAQLDVAISTIQRWEKQTHNMPTLRLDEIAAAYGCQVSDIFADGDAIDADDTSRATRPSQAVSEETLTGLLTTMLPLVPSRGMQAADVPKFARVLAYALELTSDDPSIHSNPAALAVAARAAMSRYRDLSLKS